MDILSWKRIAQYLENPITGGMQRQYTGFPDHYYHELGIVRMKHETEW